VVGHLVPRRDMPIVFGVFDKKTRTVAPGDDSGYYKKVGEKTFRISSNP
jgi:hypothetical protein